MTDNEIIKALECCMSDNPPCTTCKYDGDTITVDECMGELMKDALDLINRQRAEIERLQQNLKEAHIDIKEHQAEIEALKLINSTYVGETSEIRKITLQEFAVKVNEHMCAYDLDNYHWFRAIERDAFNDLVKEMVGDESG